MVEDYVIDKVGWHTRVKGNTESRAQIVTRFWALVQFLQDNGLTCVTLARSKEAVDDDEFCIRTTHLTPDGRKLTKLTYDKWLRRVDRGADPTDVKMFRNALKKLSSE